jgi:hypothetical protein
MLISNANSSMFAFRNKIGLKKGRNKIGGLVDKISSLKSMG